MCHAVMPDWDNAIIIRKSGCCFTKVATIADRFMQFRGPFTAKSTVIKLVPVDSSIYKAKVSE